jgi:hypothetical protein
LADYYSKAADHFPDHAADLSKRAEGSAKRSQKIEQSRRQNVTEITLEAIEGLEESDYTIDWADMSTDTINSIEETVKRFYGDIIPKINVRESQQVLKRCLKEHNRYSAL